MPDEKTTPKKPAKPKPTTKNARNKAVPVIGHMRETNFSGPPKSPDLMIRALWSAEVSIKAASVNFPDADCFGVTMSDPYSWIMAKLADTRTALESARESLRPMSGRIDQAPLRAVNNALRDLPQSPFVAKAWKDVGGDIDRWAQAARPCFDTFAKKHIDCLSTAAQDLADRQAARKIELEANAKGNPETCKRASLIGRMKSELGYEKYSMRTISRRIRLAIEREELRTNDKGKSFESDSVDAFLQSAPKARAPRSPKRPPRGH